MSVQATFSATLVDEWVRLGVTDAVVCPGSRSTPLALPLADRLRVHVRLDERSAGFFALGLAMATGRPTVICVTSGTAAAELHPAVVEAHHARVPLIVCTADRPPELHDTGAPQTIEQNGLFGAATRWAYAPGVPDEGQERVWRPLAVRAFEEAVHGTVGPGPVHLNLAFREPLTGARRRPCPLVRPEGRRRAPRRTDRTGRRIDCRAAPGPGTDHRRRPVAAAGRPRPGRWHSPTVSAGRSWPTPCRAAGWTGRSPPPMPSSARSRRCPSASCCSVRPGCRGRSGTTSPRPPAAGARIIVVDPWRQWADPLRVATEFHQCAVDDWLDGRQRHGDTVRSGVAATRGRRARRWRRRPSPTSWAPI